jgi:hypothetical protein
MDHTIKFDGAEDGVYEVTINGNPYGHVVNTGDAWAYWVQLGQPYEQAWQLVGEGPTRIAAVRDGLSNPRRISDG